METEYNINLRCDTLNPEQMTELATTIFEHKQAFVDSSGELGYNDSVPHIIHMKPNTPPMARQPYRMNPETKAAVQTQIEYMLEKGIIMEADTA